MGDVGLGVELVLVVDTAFNLASTERVQNRRDPVEERVGFLVLLDALVELDKSPRPDGFMDSLPSPKGGLRAHQYPDLVEPLPLAVECKKCANLEVPRRDVKRLGDARPFLQVSEPGPARDAVVHYEELAALSLYSHSIPSMTAQLGVGTGHWRWKLWHSTSVLACCSANAEPLSIERLRSFALAQRP